MQLPRAIATIATAAALTALAGCASTTSSTAGQGGGQSTPASSTSQPVPSGSATGVPIPAPSDAEPLTVTGAVPASVLSMTGPFQPAGPVLGTSVSDLVHKMGAATGKLECPQAGCWYGAKVPAGSVLVAVRPGLSSCYHPQHVLTVRLTASSVRLDIQLAGQCRPGAGAAARMPAMLIALAPGALPTSGSVSATVRSSTQPGAPMALIGTATTTLP